MKTYFGTVVQDSYDWMAEEANRQEMIEWANAQDKSSRAILSSLQGRSAILGRVRALSVAGPEVKTVTWVNSRLFYLKRGTNSKAFSLYVKEGAAGAERELVNPTLVAKSSVPSSIDYFQPSPDGKYVAYGLSPGGSESPTLRIVEVGSGRILPDQIDRTAVAPHWRDDSQSFFYIRLQKLPPGGSPSLKYQKTGNYLHVIGASVETDRGILGFDFASNMKIAAEDFPSVFTFPGSRYVIATLQRSGHVHYEVYVAPVDSVTGSPVWRQIASEADQVKGLDVRGSDGYFLSNRDASNSSLVHLNLSNGDMAHAISILEPGQDQLLGLVAAHDALYVRTNIRGTSGIIRVAYGGRGQTSVSLPFQGAIDDINGSSNSPGVVFRLQSWVRPPTVYHYESQSGLVDTGLTPAPVLSLSNYEAEELLVRDAHGTSIPLSIVRRKDLKMDGVAPTWLSVYGSYGISLNARFEPRRIAWLELGGIYAVCHARGGGELGKEWHEAGIKALKQNAIDDALACARYLIEHKYTSPAHLGIEGTSAGGITAGGALNQHPDLFGAALLRVPAVDLIALAKSAAGATDAPEFGSLNSPSDFAALLAISPYHHIRDRVAYPAVLLMGAANDARVPLSQPVKMAARLRAATTSNKPILLRIEHDAGHGLSVSRDQLDESLADVYTFLQWQLGAQNSAQHQ